MKKETIKVTSWRDLAEGLCLASVSQPESEPIGTLTVTRHNGGIVRVEITIDIIAGLTHV